MDWRPDHLDRASAIRIGGETDDVGEQHRDILGSNLLQRFVVLGQLLDHIGRKVTRKVGPFAFNAGVADQQRVGAPYRQRQRQGNGQEHDDHARPGAVARKS